MLGNSVCYARAIVSSNVADVNGAVIRAEQLPTGLWVFTGSTTKTARLAMLATSASASMAEMLRRRGGENRQLCCSYGRHAA